MGFLLDFTNNSKFKKAESIVEVTGCMPCTNVQYFIYLFKKCKY